MVQVITCKSSMTWALLLLGLSSSDTMPTLQSRRGRMALDAKVDQGSWDVVDSSSRTVGTLRFFALLW